MRKEAKQKKKIEASKKIIIINYIIFVGVVIATFTALFMDKDLSSIITFDMGILGLITTANGFYYTKAKQENILKMTKAYEMDDQVVKDLLLGACKENGVLDNLGNVGNEGLNNTFNGGIY